MTTDRPRPVPDLQTEPYWQGARSKALLVQECDDCSERVHPSSPCCPNCLNVDLRWIQVSGAGVVVGYCRVAQPLVAGVETPYVVVSVSLLDAPEVELIANLVGREISDIAVGAPVHVTYDVVDDDVVLPQFELTASAV